VLGEISLDGFLEELERSLGRPEPTAPPLRGVHVLRDLRDVGPGYAAVWVTGFTDAFWPEGPQGNPLLPLALQRAHALPYSSPRDAEERSAQALARLLNRTPKVVASWPARVYDYEAEPSPAIRSWPQLSAREIDELTAATGALSDVARETVEETVPAFTGTRLPGGAGALGRQARCPLRAFCQDRLGARPLEPLHSGISARLRGIATHRAAEILLRDLPSQAEIVALPAAAIAASAARALEKTFGPARRALATLFELEAERLERVLSALVRREAERAAFRVRAVEQRTEGQVGRWTLVLRIDRVDELADGSVAIIDYKTNERATSAGWFAPRLTDAQVPLYASTAAEPVRAAVIARLTPAEVSYSGFWPAAAFPGRQSTAAHTDRVVQLATWRTQLEQLATELAGGDTRIFVDDYADAGGVYAPLTRLFEQLALARGAAQTW
jgi:RecB family exonuclease